MNENGYGVYLMKWMNAMYEMNYGVEEEEDGRRVGRLQAGFIGRSPSRVAAVESSLPISLQLSAFGPLFRRLVVGLDGGVDGT